MKKLKTIFVVLMVSFLAPAYAHATSAVTDNLRDLFVELSKRLVPSVVNINTTQNIVSPYGGAQADLYRKFFEQFFGEELVPNMPPETRRATSLGSGFIFDDKENLVLTNYHVIQDADDIKVILSEEESDQAGIEAKVVGGDAEADVAILKIKTNRKLTAAPLGDSDSLQVGEWVMAVGNPFGHGHTVTKGIISAKERIIPLSQFSNFLQTDTPINPGNSGGPLINAAGEVIGINSAINAAAQGIGFAIPINYVKKLLPELRTKGVVTRGFIGVNIADLDPSLAKQLHISSKTRGVLITEVFPGEPASKAGIRPYDVITELNGKPVASGRHLIAAVSAFSPGTKVNLKVLRNGKEVPIELMVGTRPSREAMISKENGQPGKPGRGQHSFTESSQKLGMTVETLDPGIRRELGLSRQVKGVVVSQVMPGSPADEAGLDRGDVIVEVDRKATPTVEKFWARFQGKKTSFLIRFRRGDGYSITTLDLKKSGSKESMAPPPPPPEEDDGSSSES